MTIFDKIKNDSILIIPNNIKEKILLLKNKYENNLNIKIMDLEEFKKNYFFNHTSESIFFIMKNYNLNFSNAKEIIKNLYYVENKCYNNEKIKFLIDVKNNLIANNLLIYNPLFKTYISNKNIYIYGYDYIEIFYQNIFKKLHTEFINDEYEIFDNEVYEFETIDEEVDYCANKICELIDSGISINKIKIIKPSSEYENVIKRIFKLYNLPIYFNNFNLYSTKMAKDFIEHLDKDINITLEKLKQFYNLEQEILNEQFNQIVYICNKYNWCDDFCKIKEALIEELKFTKIKYNYNINNISLENLNDNIFDDDEYVFLLGFNQSTYPKTYKDDDYLNDKLKSIFNLETTTEKNKLCYDNLVTKLSSIKNLFISYKLKTPFNSYYPSQIIEDFDLKVTKIKKENVSYSKLNDKLKLSILLDNFLKYGSIDSNIGILYSTYQNINYSVYNNQYKIINEDLFKKYLKNNLLLSYSSINNFYKCGFRYYVDNILKLKNFDNDFTLFIGNLFHYILSIMYKEEFNFETDFHDYINNNYELKTYKEKFFIEKLKQELLFIINAIKQQQKFTEFDNILLEEEVWIDLSKDNYKITFKGIIDKLMYKKINDQTLISIIDYKTGNPNLNLNNIIYGIDMQLCIYAYLSSKIKKFANPQLVGIYLQKILNNEINIDKNKSYESMKLDNLKLQGYSINNESLLKSFDKTYQDSKLIKGMKVSKNGFYAYTKVFNEAMLNEILDITNKKIDEATSKIINREFYINPKKIGIKNLVGCEHCNYKDLCYMIDDNIINLKEYKKLEFLGGDNNEMD